MRVVLDTNVLISALISPSGTTGAILEAWKDRRFDLLTADVQIEELRLCFGRPRLVPRYITRHDAGHLINLIRRLAAFVEPLPHIDRSPDPNDNFLLAIAEAGQADYLVSGDSDGLLSLRAHRRTAIISPAIFVERYLRLHGN